MSNGFQFFNDNNVIAIDGSYVVPEFIGKVTLDPTPVQVVASDAEAGVSFASYAGTLPSRGAGQHVILWTLPSSSSDAWVFAQTTYLYPNTQSSIFKGGVVIAASVGGYVLPEGYVFSLDTVTPSADTMGARLWDENGKLVFDAGRPHLNLRTIIDGESVADSGITSVTGPALPAKPAFLVPEIYTRFETRSRIDGASNRTDIAFHRRIGQTIQSRIFVGVTNASPDDRSAPFGSWAAPQGNRSGLSIPVIDASDYE